MNREKLLKVLNENDFIIVENYISVEGGLSIQHLGLIFKGGNN